MKNKNIPKNWSKKLEKDLYRLTLIGLKKLGIKYYKEIMGYDIRIATEGMDLK